MRHNLCVCGASRVRNGVYFECRSFECERRAGYKARGGMGTKAWDHARGIARNEPRGSVEDHKKRRAGS